MKDFHRKFPEKSGISTVHHLSLPIPPSLFQRSRRQASRLHRRTDLHHGHRHPRFDILTQDLRLRKISAASPSLGQQRHHHHGPRHRPLSDIHVLAPPPPLIYTNTHVAAAIKIVAVFIFVLAIPKQTPRSDRRALADLEGGEQRIRVNRCLHPNLPLSRSVQLRASRASPELLQPPPTPPVSPERRRDRISSVVAILRADRREEELIGRAGASRSTSSSP